jgi:hypothetical protein
VSQLPLHRLPLRAVEAYWGGTTARWQCGSNSDHIRRFGPVALMVEDNRANQQEHSLSDLSTSAFSCRFAALSARYPVRYFAVFRTRRVA